MNSIGGDNCLKLKRYHNPGIFCPCENWGMLFVGVSYTHQRHRAAVEDPT
jgi:hypothetical protein